jgi:DNA-binding beta-propeller fold protein YncE
LHKVKHSKHKGGGYQLIGVGADPIGAAANASGYIYVANFNSGNFGNGSISVIKPTTNTVVDTINAGKDCPSSSFCDPSFLAYDPSNNIMYVSAYGAVEYYSTFLPEFNASTNSLLSAMTVNGYSPGANIGGSLSIALDPANNEIYFFDPGTCSSFYAASVYEIDVVTNKVVDSTPIGNCEDFEGILAYDPANQEMYVGNIYNLSNTYGNISVISSVTNKVVASVFSENYTFGLAYDPVSQEMYAASTYQSGSYTAGLLTEIDSTNTPVNCVWLNNSGGNYLGGVAFDPADNDMYVANFTTSSQPGPVFIIDGTTGNYLATVNAFGAVRSMAYSPANGGEMYAPDAAGSTVTELGGTSFTTFGFASGSNGLSAPTFVAYDSKNKFLYVTDYDNGKVFGFPTVSGTPVVYSGFQNPYGIAYDPSLQTLMVANRGNGTVSIINATTGAYQGPFNSGEFAYQVVYDPNSNDYLVSNPYAGNVSVFSYNTNTQSWSASTLNQEFGISPNGLLLATGIAVYYNATENIYNIYISTQNSTVTALNMKTHTFTNIVTGTGVLADSLFLTS